MRASERTVWRCGRRRTIALRRSRRNAPRCSTTTSTTSASRRSKKAKAGARSKRYPACSRAAHAQGDRAIPSPKYQQVFDDVHLPENPAFDERDARRKALKAPRVGLKTKQNLELSYRAELQSLQSVDDLVAAVVDALRDIKQARQYGACIYLRQRLPVWRPPPDRQDRRL